MVANLMLIHLEKLQTQHSKVTWYPEGGLVMACSLDSDGEPAWGGGTCVSWRASLAL